MRKTKQPANLKSIELSWFTPDAQEVSVANKPAINSRRLTGLPGKP